MSTYLVVKDQKVINAIVWEGDSEYDAGEGSQLIEVNSSNNHVAIGWTYKNNKFSPPEDTGIVHYAIYQKEDNLVVAIEILPKIEEPFLNEEFANNFGVAECDENVQPGWIFDPEEETFSQD